jgi:hypothetical protein
MFYLPARLTVTGFVSWVDMSTGTFTIALKQDCVTRTQPRSFVIQVFMPNKGCRRCPGHMPLPSTLVTLTGEVFSVMADLLAVSVDDLTIFQYPFIISQIPHSHVQEDDERKIPFDQRLL